MWEAIKQLLILAGQVLPSLLPKPKAEDENGTPSMRDVAIAQESGAVASRAGKDAARLTREAQRASRSEP